MIIYGSKENKDNSIYLPNIIQNLKIFLQNPVSQFSSFSSWESDSNQSNYSAIRSWIEEEKYEHTHTHLNNQYLLKWKTNCIILIIYQNSQN